MHAAVFLVPLNMYGDDVHKCTVAANSQSHASCQSTQIDLVHRYLREGADPDAPVGKNGMTSMARAAVLKDRQVEIALVSTNVVMLKWCK